MEHYSEIGVLNNSSIYFHTPCNMAKSMFYYMICAGEFFCSEEYRVERATYNSYLIMYIRNGSGAVSTNNRIFRVQAGDVVFLNCHQPHLYFTNTGWETLWIHFDGNASRNFYELLYSQESLVIPTGDSPVVERCLSMILEGFRNGRPLPEALVSCHIHRMLTEILLLSSGRAETHLKRESPVYDAISYIQTNFNRRITLDELAAYVKVSPFHFSRIFKKETGYSPYEYVIKTRIDHAKSLLKKTALAVKEVAYEVGFNNESNFVSTFHEKVGLTPNEFRNIPI